MYAMYISFSDESLEYCYNGSINHKTIKIAKVICFSEAVGPVPPERPNCLTANWP